MIPKSSKLLENLFTNDDACTDGLTSPLACPTPEPCEDAEKCAESFDADCVVYTGDPIVCQDTTVIAQDRTVSQALTDIVDWVCSGEVVGTQGVQGIQGISGHVYEA